MAETSILSYPSDYQGLIIIYIVKINIQGYIDMTYCKDEKNSWGRYLSFVVYT